jgi:hypothetical protein
MRIWSNPSHHCRAKTLPSSRRTGDSHADSSLGGGSPIYIVAARGVLGAGVPLDAEDQQSHAVVASLERAVFATISLQNECMLTSRSRRKNWIEN